MEKRKEKMRECFIIRGVSGCGKSTLAESLLIGVDGVKCEADDYFMKDGVYEFNSKALFDAHRVCKSKFEKALEAEKERIVVSNTNTKVSEFKEYKKLAEEAGYTVYVIVVENRHGGVNKHNVPEDKLMSMENAIKSNLKLR